MTVGGTSTQQTIQLCPTCGATLVVQPHYVTWCQHCGWNIKPHVAVEKGFFAKLYAAQGQKTSEKLLTKMETMEQLRPQLSLSKTLAFFGAGIVHLVTLVCLTLGNFILINGWPNIVAIAGALFLLGVAWVLRPQFAQLEDDEVILSRSEFPQIYRMTDAVAAVLHARPLDGIIINHEFNASFGRYGVRRRRILHLGLPLWSILAPDEKISLIGHELAHSVNGDSTRGFFVGSAINALITWSVILRPDQIWDSNDGIRGLFAIPLNLILLGVAQIAWLAGYGLVHLLWRDKQRAEYLADYLASTVSGTTAMLRMLDKLHLAATCHFAMQRIALGNNRTISMFSALTDHVQHIPEQERERLRRVQLLEGSRLDTTHPPTPYRIRFLQTHSITTSQVELSKAENSAIDAELTRLHEKIQRHIVSQMTSFGT